MDNEGLLEWAEYEVEGAWAVLMRAVSHRDELRKIVESEKDKKVNDMNALVMKITKFVEAATKRQKEENRFKAMYGIAIAEAERRGLERGEIERLEREAEEKDAEDLEAKLKKAENMFWKRWIPRR